MPAEAAAERRIALQPAETPFYIAATGAQAWRVLKFDSFGDIGTLANGEDGVFHCDTPLLVWTSRDLSSVKARASV